jgi:hypothetical protein
LMARANRIANTRQHVCDRIGQPHLFASPRHPFASAFLGLPKNLP